MFARGQLSVWFAQPARRFVVGSKSLDLVHAHLRLHSKWHFTTVIQLISLTVSDLVVERVADSHHSVGEIQLEFRHHAVCGVLNLLIDDADSESC